MTVFCLQPDIITFPHQFYFHIGFDRTEGLQIGEEKDFAPPSVHVGQYLYSGRRIAIDSADQPEISSFEILDWADVYYKTNKWLEIEYSRKVLPLANPCYIPSYEWIGSWRWLRRRKKIVDISVVCRVWPGKLERVYRLFSWIQKLRRKTICIAALTEDADTPEIREKLQSMRVYCCPGMLDQEDLFKLMASSRWNVVRMGNREAIPWRMTEALAMGCSIVVDSTPKPQWYVPMTRQNYFNCNIPYEASAEFDEEEVIRRFLEKESLAEEMAAFNAGYFDLFIAPEKLAAYILGK